MFEFYDPCASCPVPLDSPKCWECKYYNPCSSCPHEMDSAVCWGNDDDCPYHRPNVPKEFLFE